MGENPKMAGHKAALEQSIAEHGRYGGHDGRGGLQKPKDKKPLKTAQPKAPKFGQTENKVPPVGPSTLIGNMSGPQGSGSGGRSGA